MCVHALVACCNVWSSWSPTPPPAHPTFAPRAPLRRSPGSLPSYEAQVAALEALQMYAPMGHALGLSAVASQLEDRCFQVGALLCVLGLR